MSKPVDYPSAIYTPELQPKEHVLVLYPLQIHNGQPQENQRAIGMSHYMLNWTVFDGPGSDAKLVGRLQGIYWTGGNASVDLVFTDNRFDSTLKIAGYIENTTEMAIVGGTGEFAMAQGTVISKNIKDVPGERIKEFEIRAMAPTLSKTVEVTKEGPWGGNGGKEYDVKGLPLSLESVTVGYGDVVHSLEFSYIDIAGNKQTDGEWGNGGIKEKIQIAPTETVVKIDGTIGTYAGNTVAASMTIYTSDGMIHCPFGEETTKSVSSSADKNGIIVGFYVRAGDVIDKLGVYVRKELVSASTA